MGVSHAIWRTHFRFTDATFYLLLVFVCLAIYLPALNADFVLDDWYVIAHNPTIKQPALFYTIWSTDFFESFAAAGNFKLHYYRPLVESSFILDYRFWGLNAFGYRLNNVLIHAVNAALVFLLIRQLTKNRAVAMLSCIFFAVHPVHEWTVNNIIGRCDLFQTAFSLLSLLFLISYLDGFIRRKIMASLLCFLAAILSREVAIFLPLTIIGVCFYRKVKLRETLKVSWPFFAVSIAYVFLRSLYFPIADNQPDAYFSLQRGLHWFQAVAGSSLHFLCPWSVQAAIRESIGFAVGGAIAATMGVAIAAYLIRRRKTFEYNRELTFGAVFLFIQFLPVVFLLDIVRRLGPYLSEYLLYFCSVWFALMLSVLLMSLSRVVRELTVLALVVYFSFFTFNANTFWKSEEATLKRAVLLEKDDNHIAAMQILMKYSADEPKVDRMIAGAESSFSRAAWMKRKGVINRSRGQLDKAVLYFQEAAVLTPADADVYNELAVTFLNAGDAAQAAVSLSKAISLKKENPESYRLTGIVQYQKKEYVLASENLKKALFYNPDSHESLLYLAMAGYFAGNQPQYISAIDRLVSRRVPTKDIVAFVAGELIQNGRFQEGGRRL